MNSKTKSYPFLVPNPPKLSECIDELRAIEESGHFSNFGPVNTQFENEIIKKLFSNEGFALTVSNATIALMVAIKAVTTQAFGDPKNPWLWSPNVRKYAVMPSFTFAAAAHAAIWNGLTPLFCDIDPQTWLPCAKSEARLLEKYGEQIAVFLPYATFGNCLDLGYYEELSQRTGIPVVVDAAASLGSKDINGKQFGTGCSFPIIYSMHATKTFATTEAGLIYSSDRDLIATLRLMTNFGFGEPRSATMPGLNGKLSEYAALLCLKKLEQIDKIVTYRELLVKTFESSLPTNFRFQKMIGRQHAYQFLPVAVNGMDLVEREKFFNFAKELGITLRAYFSPELSAQSYFKNSSISDTDLHQTQTLAKQIVSLPVYDELTLEGAKEISHLLGRFFEGKT